MYEIIRLKDDAKNKSINALKHYVYRFMQRYFLSFRVSTHVGQIIPADALNKIKEFYKDLKIKRIVMQLFYAMRMLGVLLT
jgi:hypothetical protein